MLQQFSYLNHQVKYYKSWQEFNFLNYNASINQRHKTLQLQPRGMYVKQECMENTHKQ